MKKFLPFLIFAGLLGSGNMNSQAFSISVSGNHCIGSTGNAVVTNTVPGATSYTFLVMGPCNVPMTYVAPQGSAVAINYTCCGTFSIYCQPFVNGTTPIGSPVMQTVAVTCSAACTPVVTGGGQLCAGSLDTLSASGCSGYTWQPGSLSGPSIVVTPSVSTCYTLISENGNCTNITQHCIVVLPLPNVQVAASSQTACAGSAVTMTASGAVSYIWSIGATGTSVFVFPTSSTCFSVMGMDQNGCTNMASHCVNVMPRPTLTVSGNTSPCLGSSTTLTITGANTYNWKITPPSTNSVVTILTNGLNFVVGGTSSAGCYDSTFVSVTPSSTCAIVWPGDANSDGVVNAADVLELGLLFNSTGASRQSASISYSGQHATAWTGSGSNSQNKVHGDCNGDGTVNMADTMAIWTNFSLTHTFRQAGGQALNDDIMIVAPSQVLANAWNKVDILLNPNSTHTNNIYGLAFDVTFDASKIDNNNVFVTYPQSFLNPQTNNVPFRKIGNGVAYCANARTDGNNVSGGGKIGELYFKTASGTEASVINFGIANAVKINAAGVTNTLSAATASSAIISGIGENSRLQAARIYPNPANSSVMLVSGGAGRCDYSISDLTGKVIMDGQFDQHVTLDVRNLANGVYFVTTAANQQRTVSKLVIQH